MRRLLLLAAFALVLAVTPCLAQRGGMRAAPAAHFAAAPRMSSPAMPARFTAAPHVYGYHTSGEYHSCWNCGHVHHPYYPYYGYYGRYWHVYGYPYAYSYPYYGWGYSYYGPTLWDQSSYSDTDNSYQRQLVGQIDSLSQQVQNLQDQISDLQQHPASAPSPAAPPPPPLPPTASAKSAPSDLPTILVFRDQRIQEVANYAIVGKTLVVVQDQRSKKIPLADLDLAATAKLNAERGVDFELPR
jgi:hypothetical protein